MLSRFFIDRPVFAWVIAIVIMLAGAIAALSLPVEQYPVIAPPAVVISAVYPGADAESLQNSVTQVIEQQLTGVDHLLYFSSSSTAAGTVSITATFEPGIDPDIAQVQVQNKLQQAVPILPAEVQQQGITVAKAQSNFIIVIAVADQSGRYDNVDIADFVVSRMQDPISRVSGVGNVQVFGSQYAMRIWLDPFKLHNYGLEPSDIRGAILAQNTQVSAGQIGGQPATAQTQLNATVTSQSRLQTPQQFRDIILKTSSSGAVVHLSDVARVEIGADAYVFKSLLNGKAASGMAGMLGPGANALRTVDMVKQRAESLRADLPPGMVMSFPLDNTEFIRLSIHDVVVTLIVAICLVVLVMFIFLQNWRVTLVPAVAVPVVLLGTFGVLAAFGYTINTLTLFALVLVIGLLVDDAIVVVENVERIMHEERLPPREATLKSMQEITGALIGIGLVLTAVFLPMAFFGGSTGVIYRQFSVTIVSAMTLSILVALVLSPSLCATLLKPVAGEGHLKHGFFFDAFNRNFEAFRAWYHDSTAWFLRRTWGTMIAYAVIIGVMAFIFIRLPTGFLPDEDQGFIITQITLPTGAVQQRTLAVAQQVSKHFNETEKANVEFTFVVAGFSFSGAGQNAGLAFTHLRPWDERKGFANSAQSVAQRAFGAFMGIRDAQIYPLVPPSVQELGQSAGFDLFLEDRGNIGHTALMGARNQVLGMAMQDTLLAFVRPNALEDSPQLHVDIDQAKANSQGVALTNVNSTLSAAWGSTYINDFIDRGRVKRVYMQGDAPFRMAPEDLNRWYVRTTTGTMAPFSSFATSRWVTGPSSLTRYNGFPAIELLGAGKAGVSSGTATQETYKIFGKLPRTVGYELTGLSYQEQASGSQAPALYALSILVIYLCRAALYESWAIPL